MGKFLIFQFSCSFAAFIYCSAAKYDSEELSSLQNYDRNNLITTLYNNLQTFQFLNSKWTLFLKMTDWNFVLKSALNSAQVSSKCLSDVNFILSNSGEPWRLPILSYSGKLDSSFFNGNHNFLGNYNGCIRIKSRNSSESYGNFNGKYCTLSILLLENNSLVNNVLVPFKTGICVPDTCSTDDLEKISNILKLSSFLPTLNYTKLSCKTSECTLNAPAKGVLAALSLFCILALLGSSFTVVDYARRFIEPPTLNVSDSDCNKENSDYKKNNDSKGDVSISKANLPKGNHGLNKVKQILQCFCIFTNGAKILNTDSTDGQFLFFNGIRFLNMSWVILAHTYAFSIDVTENLLDFTSALDDIGYQIPLQGGYAVDSFLLLSAFLLAYLTMKKFSETKAVIPWLYLYIHRYVRISSTYFIVLGVWATIFLCAGSGPFWPDSSDIPCTKNWWWNLLYINNFNQLEDMCMQWSWFLAMDMQLFVISPLFLIALWRRPKIGYGLLATFLVAGCFANFLISYHSNLLAGYGHIVRNVFRTGVHAQGMQMSNLDQIYTKPYSRMSSYLIGIGLGYFCFKQRVTYKAKHGLLFLSIGWIVAITIILVSVFGLYHNDLDLLASCFYNSFHRIVFVLGESWIIYVCFIGQGGVVDKILSWKMFIPLSRLTYVAYLIHPIIILWYLLSLKTTFFFSHITVLLLFLGFLVSSYVLALPVCLLYESPIVRLEKLLRNSIEGKEEQLVRHDKEL